MASLSATGTEVYRLRRLNKDQPEKGALYVVLSIRSNLAVLKTGQLIVEGRSQTGRWKRALSAAQARERKLTTAEALRDRFMKDNFTEIPTVRR